jgi:hypothetical protein
LPPLAALKRQRDPQRGSKQKEKAPTKEGAQEALQVCSRSKKKRDKRGPKIAPKEDRSGQEQQKEKKEGKRSKSNDHKGKSCPKKGAEKRPLIAPKGDLSGQGAIKKTLSNRKGTVWVKKRRTIKQEKQVVF